MFYRLRTMNKVV